MSKMQLKKDDADAFKKIAKEDLETIICTSIDLLEETFILIGYDTEGMVFDKDNIEDLFKVINDENAEYTYYINENYEQEIKIEYVDNSQFILLNIG
jgi:hypothetical protein